jgi:ribonuclease P protein component
MDRPNTLNKSERLKSRKIIGELFSVGQSAFQYPLKCVYLQCTPLDPASSSLLFGATVSKRNFKQAVKRNLIKRHIREAYRLNKPVISQEEPKQTHWALMYIYVSKNQEDISMIPDAMRKINKKILKRIAP